MQTEYESPFQGLNYLIDSFWAAIPEKTADDIAKFKKDVLTRVKDAVDAIIEDEIKWIDVHVENARRMRQNYQRPADANPPV
jgi:hypothetical protein